MSKKHIIFLISITLVLAQACTSSSMNSLPPANVETWVRKDADELARSSTDIIRAEVLDSREKKINTILGSSNLGCTANRFVKSHTVYKLRVIEIFKGSTEVGDIVEIMIENKGSSNNQLSLFSGDDLVFFLRNFESGNLPMALEGGSQGVFRTPLSIADNDLAESIKDAFYADPLNSDIALTRLDSFSKIELSIGDLMRIFEKSE